MPEYAAGEVLDAADFNWHDWTPTTANLTLGNGTIVARYRELGSTVHYRFIFTFGSSGSAVGTTPTFTLPVEPHANYVAAASAGVPVGAVWIEDTSTSNHYVGMVHVLTGSTATMTYSSEAAGGSVTGITSTAPITWASGDKLIAYGTYETAA